MVPLCLSEIILLQSTGYLVTIRNYKVLDDNETYYSNSNNEYS